MQYWDLTTALCLVFTMFVTPYEVGMDLVTKLDPLFFINQLVTCIFLCDIMVQFFLPLRRKDGSYERRHVRIAWAYLTSWCLLDVASVIPFDVMVLAGVLSGPVKVVKLARIMRLLKLVKVLRASSIFERWEASIAIPSATLSLASWTFGAVVALHWFACGWGLLGALHASQRGELGSETQLQLEAGVIERLADAATSMGASGDLCTGCITSDLSSAAICDTTCLTECEREVLAEQRDALSGFTSYQTELLYVYASESWKCRAVDSGYLSATSLEPDGAPFEVYVAALLVSMLTLVGGVASLSPQNFAENLFFFVAILFGTVLFAAVQGIICGVVTTGDPDEIAWRQNNDALNFLMSDCNMEHEMRVKVRMFFKKSKKMLKRQSYEELVDRCLSQELRGDVRYYISSGFFANVTWLQGVSRAFLEDLSTKIRRESFSKKEIIDCHDQLVVIDNGVASRAGAFLTNGSYWGDVLIHSMKLRDNRPATAVTYCETGKMTRDDLYDVLKYHPEIAAHLKTVGLRLAFERAMIIIAAFARLYQKQRRAHKQQEANIDPAMALRYVLHREPQKTWNEPSAARHSDECVSEAKADEADMAKKHDELILSFEQKSSKQQTVLLARMMLDMQREMTLRMNAMQERLVARDELANATVLRIDPGPSPSPELSPDMKASKAPTEGGFLQSTSKLFGGKSLEA